MLDLAGMTMEDIEKLMMHKFLHLKGLSLRGGLNTGLHKRRHRNQLIDGDAAFIRDLTDPEDVPDETLKHLAILADAVLESFDLAVRCLDLLIARGADASLKDRGGKAAADLTTVSSLRERLTAQ